MPLVTRTTTQGNVFKEDTEPPNWLDGDLWSDTNTNTLKKNVSGTAVIVGASTQTLTIEGDTLFRNATVPARLAIGTAAQILAVNAGADAPEWVDLASNLEILETYEAASAEASKTFSSLTINSDLFSSVILKFSGTPSAALALRIKINAVATGYKSFGMRYDVAGIALDVTAADTTTGFEIASTDVINAADRPFFGFCEFTLTDIEATENVGGYSNVLCSTTGAAQTISHHNTGDLDPITSIEFLATANWEIGTKITLYGVKR